MRRVLILLAITALACRDKEAKQAPPAAPVAPAPAPPAAPPKTASSPNPPAERPELPTFGSASGSASAPIAQQFENEPVDAMWKSRTEGDLKRAFAKMKHPPAEAECRTRICKLTIGGGSETEIETSLDELQSLRDSAQSLLLTAPVKDANGRMKVVAYLEYERPVD